MTTRPFRCFLIGCITLISSVLAGVAWAQNADVLGIKPYQASPEFPVKPSTGLSSPTGQDIQQGYQPSASALDGTAPAQEQETAIDPNTGELVSAVPQVVDDPKQQAQFEDVFTKKAVLYVTDKISANTKILTVDVPSKADVYELTIQLEKCYVSGDGADPEHAVLLEVYEHSAQPSAPDNGRIFAGWMFKKRPSLTSLQSAYYDVTLSKCIMDSPRKAVTLERIAPSGNTEQHEESPDIEDGAQSAPPANNAEPVSASQAVPSEQPQEDTAKQEADKAVDAVTKILGDAPESGSQELPSQD